ncbi:hypothetical protein T552_00747 [Pneumocystis carinii B80]|uniref:RRM domain-containing protein n=1 Tax=Pneumocystis carinii (strain B80) TaxID=1408658 RepID=A0A0W4ZPI8_PNEC8|nr:hypothetical protein T552_00747 [Pneumocystis carinii B80]KTW30271.1 hypothetical protein T552_00747 [Pneumocystis carinii B80]
MGKIQEKRIFIGNLPINICKQDLERWLLSFGKIIGPLEIIRKLQGKLSSIKGRGIVKKKTGRENCFAYASLEMTEESWNRFQSESKKNVFVSCQLRVEEAKPLYQDLKIIENERNQLDCISKVKLRKKWTRNVLYGSLAENINLIKDEMVNDETKGWFKGTYGRSISIMRFKDAITGKKKILFDPIEKINLKKLDGEIVDKNVLELTYLFDESSGQWFNGKFDRIDSGKIDIKINEELEKSLDYQFKQEKQRNLFILNEMFHDPLIEEKLNKENESNLFNFKEHISYQSQNSSESFNKDDYVNAETVLTSELITKDDLLNKPNSEKTFSLKTEKSTVNLEELKSIFSSKKEVDLQNIQENNFCFFDDNSDSDDEIINENHKETNVNANNIPILNKRCFFNNYSREFPLFFPHFNNQELYTLSVFSKVPNIFSQEINNEEIEKKWLDTRKEFTRDWKRKWKEAQKRKRRLLRRKI